MKVQKPLAMCFSGHRPEKLPANGNESFEGIKQLKSLIGLHIYEAINEGYNVFYTGMARGIDMYAAAAVIDLQRQYRHIKLKCAVPYRGQIDRCKGKEAYDYGYIMNHADEVIYLQENYTRDCMRKRNQYMVDHSDKLLAVVGSYKSGTGMTINMAKRKGIPIDIIDLNTLESLFELYPDFDPDYLN